MITRGICFLGDRHHRRLSARNNHEIPLLCLENKVNNSLNWLPIITRPSNASNHVRDAFSMGQKNTVGSCWSEVLTIVVNGWWRKHEVAKHFREFSVLVLMMLFPVLTMEIPSSCSAGDIRQGEMHASPYFNVNSGVVLISDYWDFMVQCRNFSRLEKAVRVTVWGRQMGLQLSKKSKSSFHLLARYPAFISISLQRSHAKSKWMSANFIFFIEKFDSNVPLLRVRILSYS